ncbi:MAG: chromate efflux transporter [Pseudomonadota bacterium]
MAEKTAVRDAASAKGWPPVSFVEASRLWLKIGFLSFGGPAAQIALMHRLLIEEKGWIGERRFLHALNYCMLLPGPEAQQLAVYIGWLLHKTWGGIVAGAFFVLPGALVMLILSVLYAGFQEITFVQAVFFGIKAAVLAIVIEAVIRIGRHALKTGILYGLAAAAFVAIFFFEVPFPLIVLGAALIGFLGSRYAPARFGIGDGHQENGERAALDAAFDEDALPHTRPSLARALKVLAVCIPLWFGPVAVLVLAFGGTSVFVQEAIFFSKMAVVTFGGAYAVLAYVAQEAVAFYQWLTPGEMLDGLGLAETTPGPLIMVVQFVGFLGAYRDAGGMDPMLAGALGALLTTWVTFVPCFLWIFLGAPYVEALHGKKNLSAALSAVTAAVVGVILNLGIWFALHVLFGTVTELRPLGVVRLLVPDFASLEPAALILSFGALVAMLKLKIGMLPVLAAAAALGAGYYFLVLA